MSTISIPIFPLHTVLFPDGTLPLKIFEPRYLEMVSNCMKKECGFGICLIRNGSEIGKAADIHDTGTLSEISYFDMETNGLLHITASGKQRFTILSKQVQANQLTVAEVTLIPNDPTLALPEKFFPAGELLKRLLEQLGYPFIKIEKKYDDAGWVSSRLVELLPLGLEQKQRLLLENDPAQRLETVCQLIKSLGIR